MTANAFVASVFLAASGFFEPTTPHWLIVAVLLVGGCFRSLQFTSINAIGYAEISHRDMSSATALTSVAQQLSLSIGVALGAAILQAVNVWRGDLDLTAQDFGPAFFLVALISASSGFVFARLAPDAGAEMSGHQAIRAKPTGDAT
jgi:hypothetical protein